MYENNNEPILNFSELFEKLNDPKFYHRLAEQFENLSNESKSEFEYDSLSNYRYIEDCGNIKIEVIITGHTPECVKVKYNDKTNVLKIVDECKVPEENRPWYYKVLELEFQLPETTLHDTFAKHVENGVLTVTAKYGEDKDAEKHHIHEI